MQFLRKIFKLGPIEGENSAWPKIDVKKLSHGQPRGVIDDGAPSSSTPFKVSAALRCNYGK